jgi:hypothetical protein
MDRHSVGSAGKIVPKVFDELKFLRWGKVKNRQI